MSKGLIVGQMAAMCWMSFFAFDAFLAISDLNGFLRSKPLNCSMMASLVYCPQNSFGFKFGGSDEAWKVAFGLIHSATKLMVNESQWDRMGGLLYFMLSIVSLTVLAQNWCSLDVAVWCFRLQYPWNVVWYFLCTGVAFFCVGLSLSYPCGMICSGTARERHSSESLRRLKNHHPHGSIVWILLMMMIHPVMTVDRLLLAVGFKIYYDLVCKIDEEDLKYGKLMMAKKKVCLNDF
ncbi:unnamed protein product [Notodromas monacha]|uniref:Uncharacterized protein n=1 Tax=Notodromas monacha TaxID=399045 RepID=A0A7R9BGD2_9CRUS|nr:unnamed protein product [Notodromas monacha]CAG0914983.1 unnamed protein product [Notodromas monacha]